MEQNCTLLHAKVNVSADAITKLVVFNLEYTNKIKAKSEKDPKVFVKME